MSWLDLGGVQVRSLCGGRFRLDAGTMFGVVPRPLWAAVVPTDERGRMRLACNCLLVQASGRLSLVDSGLGERWSDRQREIFAFEADGSLASSLALADVAPERIDRVVLTHLHFDHVSGCLRAEGDRLVPAFPRAEYLVQRGEWEDARAGRSTMRSSYRLPELEALAASGRVRFLPGDVDLGDGLSAFVTGGHTEHHQGVLVRGERGVLLYPADLVSTVVHLRPFWTTAYDMYPYEGLRRKAELLERAAAAGWLLGLNHDPDRPWVRLRREGEEYLPHEGDAPSASAAGRAA